MKRQGFTKVPNYVLDDIRLTSKHLGLLWRLASHAPGFVVKSDNEIKALRVSEDTFLKLMRDVESGDI